MLRPSATKLNERAFDGKRKVRMEDLQEMNEWTVHIYVELDMDRGGARNKPSPGLNSWPMSNFVLSLTCYLYFNLAYHCVLGLGPVPGSANGSGYSLLSGQHCTEVHVSCTPVRSLLAASGNARSIRKLVCTACM